MFGSDRDYILVSKFVRTLFGASNPVLVEASDGQRYVIKHGGNVPSNEALGTELYWMYGMPVPEWRPLLLTRKFIDENPACWPAFEEGLQSSPAVLCFGSRFLESPQRRCYQILPGSSMTRVHNRSDFWLAWLIDICAGHTDDRQAIFIEQPNRMLQAVFIDHGNMFGGPRANEFPKARASRHLDGRIYPPLTNALIAALHKRAQSVNLDMLHRRLNGIPEQWKHAHSFKLISECVRRLSSRQELIETLDAIEHHAGGLSSSSCAETQDRLLPPRKPVRRHEPQDGLLENCATA